MSDNLTLYNALRTVPETAKKEIQAIASPAGHEITADGRR